MFSYHCVSVTLIISKFSFIKPEPDVSSAELALVGEMIH